MSLGWFARIRDFVKWAVRTRSLHAARLLLTERTGVAEVHLPGFAGTFRLRTGTSDAMLLRESVQRDLPREYDVRPAVAPQVILDIGANIGAVTAAFVRRWPQARVYAFEPLPENFALLRHNVAQFPQVTALPYGLGAETAQRCYVRSDDPRNYGGGGFLPKGGTQAPDASGLELPIVAVAEAFRELGLARVDLIKIDTEGSEFDILTNLPPAVLDTVQVIVGELHNKPRDRELLEFLETRFEIERPVRRGSVKHFKALRRPNRASGGARASAAAAAR